MALWRDTRRMWATSQSPPRFDGGTTTPLVLGWTGRNPRFQGALGLGSTMRRTCAAIQSGATDGTGATIVPGMNSGLKGLAHAVGAALWRDTRLM